MAMMNDDVLAAAFRETKRAERKRCADLVRVVIRELQGDADDAARIGEAGAFQDAVARLERLLEEIEGDQDD